MNDERLILLVEANECIYNKYSPSYKLADKKKEVWRKIAAELNSTEELCMKRWACMRDRYAREKRMEKLPSGSGSSFRPPWPLMKTMEFIAPHVVPRPMRSSGNVLDEHSGLSMDISSQSSESQNELCIDVSPETFSFTSQSPTLPSPLPSTPFIKRKRNNVSDDVFWKLLVLLKLFVKQRKKKRTTKKRTHFTGLLR